MVLRFNLLSTLALFFTGCAAIDETALSTGNRPNEWGNWLTVGTTANEINTLQLKLCVYQDNPVLVYQNSTNIETKIYKNSGWINLPTITPSSSYIRFLCSGTTSQLIIAVELSLNSGITVYRYSGSNWNEDSPQPVSSATINDLTLSGDGTLLAYTDTSTSPQVSKVLKYSGSSWQSLGGVSSSIICYDNAIANVGSKPYHSCRNESSNGTLKVANYGTSWTESAGLTSARASMHNIKSNNSKAYLSYILAVGASSNRLVSAEINTDNSITDLSMPSITDVAAYATSLDQAGSFWVAFPAAGDEKKLAVSVYEGGQWIYKGISLSAASVSVLDMAHTSSYTYLAYADSLNGGKVLVKRYTE